MLSIQRLYKFYGSFRALDGLNLEINKGEIFGFVGPNGAGKTTAMRIMSGLLKSDGGCVYINGIDALHDQDRLKEKIGYMPDFFGVYDNLKAIEYMEFYASAYGIWGTEAKKLSLELLELVNLTDRANNYVDGLSRGMKQRLCLARTLVHNPELLILDEPASGLDPRTRFEMKEILKNLKDMGKTIIISSHILSELAEMCTNVGIIENGSMVLQGKIEEILAQVNTGNPLIITVFDKLDIAMQLLKENPLIKSLSVQDKKILVTFLGDGEQEAVLLKQLIEHDVLISSFMREQGNLESVFMEITGKNKTRGMA